MQLQQRRFFKAAVHPHARGEHAVACRCSVFSSGSSPRSWGTQKQNERGSHTPRFIPTLVGNTGQARKTPSTTSAHPHARGEHAVLDIAPPTPAGSSPRSWGTLFVKVGNNAASRFIPTLVGNTTKQPGETIDYTGSSPRSWGTRFRLGTGRLERRFIPTLVGNTQEKAGGTEGAAVHPHARGEHLLQVGEQRFVAGSSPRSWGTQSRSLGYSWFFWFIPTLVGNTPTMRSKRSKQWVHPHARGEHKNARAHLYPHSGSSPRSWGTRAGQTRRPLRSRFIPTLVGNTGSRLMTSTIPAVHPHARGEHIKTAE